MIKGIKPHSRIVMLSFGLCLMIASKAWSDMVDAKTLLAQADAAYAKREDVSQATIALGYYEKLGELGGIYAAEGGWKAARAAWWLAEHMDNRADRLATYQRGAADAQKAVELNADSAAAHFWLGVNQGSFGNVKGIMKSLSLVKPIRHEMNEVLRLDEHFSDGGAWRTLGVVDYKVPGMMGGNKSRAKEELEKALAIGPDNPFNHYYMAEYSKTIGDQDRKSAEIAALQALPDSAELGPETKMMKDRANRQLK